MRRACSLNCKDRRCCECGGATSTARCCECKAQLEPRTKGGDVISLEDAMSIVQGARLASRCGRKLAPI